MAKARPNPDQFKLSVGCLAKANGHKFIHEELIKVEKMEYSEAPLERYFYGLIMN